MTAAAPEVCVLLPVRNGAAHVAIAIDSVLRQSVPGLKLVVSDNHSTDATPSILARYADDPRVEVVRPEAPLDMMAHFNRCLGLVEGRYYMLLCHDDYLASDDALARARDALERDPGIAAAYCDLRYVDEAGHSIAVRRFPRPPGRVDSDALARRAVLGNRNLFGIPLLVRTAALGGRRYDPALPYSSDLDLSIAISSGGAIFHIDAPLIANRFHASNASVALFRRAAHELDRIAEKHGIELGVLGRLRRRLAVGVTALQKWAFFRWLAWRARRIPGAP